MREGCFAARGDSNVKYSSQPLLAYQWGRGRDATPLVISCYEVGGWGLDISENNKGPCFSAERFKRWGRKGVGKGGGG
jgi:hypothetical protein